jgi:hypothetical protein
MRDKSIVKEIGEAPHDWVPIEGTRYSQDQIFKEAVGKSIEPQALTMLESINPDYNNFRQAWDMVTGLVKMGLTAGNPTNWQTQMLGNVALLTTKVPWFQIPSRLAKAAITLAGIGQGARERLEKYRRWNWTHHTNDATREMAQLLAKGSVLEMEGTALPDNPYLGMSFFETLGEAVKRAGHGRFRSSMRGFTKAGIDVFTSLDAMARVALHEYLTDTMKMDETASRKIVDKYYDIQHLPKGWQFTRRWFNQFGSINAVMARNLGELVPNSPAAITNLSMLAYMWNLAYQGLTGMSDEDKDRIIDASIPNNNGFTNWIGKKTAFLWPKGDGTTRVIDMNKFSPVDTGLRAFPGLAPTVQGLANVAAEGRWAPGMDGKDIAGNFADFAASNLLYGPQVDWFFNRDRFNEGQPIRETMDEPGTFGRTGYLRYMIERGNLPGMFSAALPPGAREFAAATIPSGVKNIRRIGESSDTGFLGTRPRYVTGTDEKGKAVARKYDRLDAALEAMGFQFARADEYARVRELAERSSSDLIKGKFGLSKRRTVEAGSPEAAQTGQAIRDADAMGDMNRALRLVAQIKHYESLPLNDRTTVGEQITKTIGSPDNLRDMISILWQMEEYDLSRDIGAFFEQEHGMNLIPAKATGAERMSKGRFGSLRENK